MTERDDHQLPAQFARHHSEAAFATLANPDGVVVAFADGRALLVPPTEVAKLRWAP